MTDRIATTSSRTYAGETILTIAMVGFVVLMASTGHIAAALIGCLLGTARAVIELKKGIILYRDPIFGLGLTLIALPVMALGVTNLVSMQMFQHPLVMGISGIDFMLVACLVLFSGLTVHFGTWIATTKAEDRAIAVSKSKAEWAEFLKGRLS